MPSRPCAVNVHWCLRLGLALLTGPIDVAWVGWVHSLSLHDLLPRPLHWPGSVSGWNGGNSLAGGETVSVWKVVEVDLLHPRRKLVVWLWWRMSSTSLWCWPGRAVLLVLFVDFQWSVKIGWASLRNSYCVFWPFPSRSIEYIKCTFLAQPCSGRDWMRVVGYVYLMDVFHAVISAPPLISLVLHLKLLM